MFEWDNTEYKANFIHHLKHGPVLIPLKSILKAYNTHNWKTIVTLVKDKTKAEQVCYNLRASGQVYMWLRN